MLNVICRVTSWPSLPDCPSFSTESSMPQETPGSQAKQAGWSLQGGTLG